MDNYRPSPGTLISDIETPCLFIDMDAMESNFKVIDETYKDTVCKMRQHTKNTKSPRLAMMQINAGGTLNGVCTAKLSEAEVMVEGGITDVLIPNQIVTEDKIRRLCALQSHGDVKVCVYGEENTRLISKIASELGVTVGILIEVDTSMERGGVRSSEESVYLAKLITSLPGLKFMGVMSHQHLEEFSTHENRIAEGIEYMEICVESKRAIEAEGIHVEMVSSGETFTIDSATQVEGVTEVEGGTYALMGTSYSYMDDFKIANKVLGTITSIKNDQIAIGDIGTKSFSWPEKQLPDVETPKNIKVVGMHPENCELDISNANVQVGDNFVLLPWYQDMLVNRWDQYVGIRNNKVEQVIDIPGRGCTQ